MKHRYYFICFFTVLFSSCFFKKEQNLDCQNFKSLNEYLIFQNFKYEDIKDISVHYIDSNGLKKVVNIHPGTEKGQKAINDHFHIFNLIDGVQGGLAGDEEYATSPKTTNFEIDVSSKYRKGGWKKGPLGIPYYDTGETLDAHSFDVENPKLIEKQMSGKKLKEIK